MSNIVLDTSKENKTLEFSHKHKKVTIFIHPQGSVRVRKQGMPAPIDILLLGGPPIIGIKGKLVTFVTSTDFGIYDCDTHERLYEEQYERMEKGISLTLFVRKDSNEIVVVSDSGYILTFCSNTHYYSIDDGLTLQDINTGAVEKYDHDLKLV